MKAKRFDADAGGKGLGEEWAGWEDEGLLPER